MYSIIECTHSEAAVTFHFATPGLADELWTHTSLRSPLVEWLENVLLPLTMESGDAVSVQAVTGRLIELAESRGMLATSIDWLGLALLAAQEYREAAAALHESNRPELQARCAACFRLASILYQFDERLAHELGRSVSSAA
jgi:hypothetical protein